MTTTGGPIIRTKDDLPAGTQLGRYRIEDPVGRGGMGTVYRAFDETTNRNVAVKLLAEGIPPSLRERFLAECEAEANIRHEHVMPVYDRGWLTEERPYFVMELLYEPITLAELMDVINSGMLGSSIPRLRAWNDARRLIEDVILPICEGVAVANGEYGIQHRDLKPDNVLIDIRTRRAYLIDFGICRSMDDDKDRGRIVGTPRFLSPEQAAAGTSEWTDVWGLGAILRYVVSGEPPLAGTSPFTRAEVDKRIAALTAAETRAREAGEEAKARGYGRRREQLEDPTLRVQEDLLRDAIDGVYLPLPENMSAGLAAIIQKAMAKEPAQRYATAGDLARDVRTWVQGGGVQALSEKSSSGALVDLARRLLNRNTVRVGGALVALVVGLAFGTGLFTKTPPRPDHRLEDALAEVAAIDSEWHALIDGGQGVPPVGLGAIGHVLREHSVAAAKRGRAAAGPGRDEETERRRLHGDVLKLSQVTFEGWPRAQFEVQALTGLTPPPWDKANEGATRGFLRPGVYQFRSTPQHGVRLLMTVPATPTCGFSRDRGMPVRSIHLGPRETRVPGDMIWVPAGRVAIGGDEVFPAFLAGRDLVTNEKYSEWLDDLPASDRLERLPPTGFVRAERDTRRWLVAQGMASKPVLGVRPQDAAAYAAWRSAAEGAEVSVASEWHWVRMAAIQRMGDPGAGAIFPWRAAPEWKVKHRRGSVEAIPKMARIIRGESPHGVRGLFAGPGEIVVRSTVPGFAVKGKGGMIPLVSAATRSEPIAADARGHGFGFRIVVEP